MEWHALRLGDVAIVTNTFELYTDYGVQMKARSPAVERLTAETTRLLSQAQAFAQMGLTETAQPLWQSAASLEESVALQPGGEEPRRAFACDLASGPTANNRGHDQGGTMGSCPPVSQLLASGMFTRASDVADLVFPQDVIGDP